MKKIALLIYFVSILIAQNNEEKEKKVFELLSISKPLENVLPGIEFISHLSKLNGYKDSTEIRKVYEEVFDKKKFYKMIYDYLLENYHPVFIDQLIAAFSNSKLMFINDDDLVNKLNKDVFYTNFYRNFEKISVGKISGRTYHLTEQLTEVQLKSELFIEILKVVNSHFHKESRKNIFEIEQEKTDEEKLAKSFIRALYLSHCEKISFSKLKSLINFAKSDAGQLYYRGLEKTYTKFYSNSFAKFVKKAGI